MIQRVLTTAERIEEARARGADSAWIGPDVSLMTQAFLIAEGFKVRVVEDLDPRDVFLVNEARVIEELGL